MENNFKNFNYKLINSSLKEHHEVCVSFIYSKKVVKRFIYIKDKKNAKSQYYISEAKKRIDEEIKNGKLLEYAKKYIENIDKKDHRKGILIFFVIFMSAAALALAGLFTWKYLAGSEDNPPPGPETYTVSAVIANSDIAVGYSLKYKDKVEKGKDYQTTIELNKLDTVPRECFLPPFSKHEGERFVTVKINDSDYDQFTYTPTVSESGIKEAGLSIPQNAITGNITISIKLTSKQPTPVYGIQVRFDQETKEGKSIFRELAEYNKEYNGTITLSDISSTLDLNKFSVKTATATLERGPDGQYEIAINTERTYEYNLRIYEGVITETTGYIEIHAPLAQ